MRRMILLFVLLFPLAASAASFSSLYVFGDSLSDPGNIPGISGYNYPPPPYADNRFSNGSVAVQYLAPLLGLTLDNSKNYAQGGATTGYTNVLNASSGGPLAGDPLTGVLGQVGGYLGAAAGADPAALYVVWAGPNDILAGLQDPANFDPAATIAGAMGNLSTAITELANAGARHFFVPNMPDLGMTPKLFGTPDETSGTQLSAAFDQQLAVLLAQLRGAPGMDILSFDTFGLVDAVVADPGKYGFTNVTDRCIVDPVCSTSPAVAQGYLFWDDIHPTTQGHAVLASAMGSAIVPVPAALPLLLSGLMLLLGLTRGAPRRRA